MAVGVEQCENNKNKINHFKLNSLRPVSAAGSFHFIRIQI